MPSALQLLSRIKVVIIASLNCRKIKEFLNRQLNLCKNSRQSKVSVCGTSPLPSVIENPNVPVFETDHKYIHLTNQVPISSSFKGSGNCLFFVYSFI